MVPNDRSSEIEINYKKYKKVPFYYNFGDLRSRKKVKIKIENAKLKIT